MISIGIAGYLYTAATLTGTLIDTMWFMLALVVVHQLCIRWLLLVHRRLSFQALINPLVFCFHAIQQVERNGCDPNNLSTLTALHLGRFRHLHSGSNPARALQRDDENDSCFCPSLHRSKF